MNGTGLFALLTLGAFGISFAGCRQPAVQVSQEDAIELPFRIEELAVLESGASLVAFSPEACLVIEPFAAKQLHKLELPGQALGISKRADSSVDISVYQGEDTTIWNLAPSSQEPVPTAMFKGKKAMVHQHIAATSLHAIAYNRGVREYTLGIFDQSGTEISHQQIKSEGLPQEMLVAGDILVLRHGKGYLDGKVNVSVVGYDLQKKQIAWSRKFEDTSAMLEHEGHLFIVGSQQFAKLDIRSGEQIASVGFSSLAGSGALAARGNKLVVCGLVPGVQIHEHEELKVTQVIKGIQASRLIMLDDKTLCWTDGNRFQLKYANLP